MGRAARRKWLTRVLRFRAAQNKRPSVEIRLFLDRYVRLFRQRPEWMRLMEKL
jgi:hypothetical protein